MQLKISTILKWDMQIKTVLVGQILYRLIIPMHWEGTVVANYLTFISANTKLKFVFIV